VLSTRTRTAHHARTTLPTLTIRRRLEHTRALRVLWGLIEVLVALSHDACVGTRVGFSIHHTKGAEQSHRGQEGGQGLGEAVVALPHQAGALLWPAGVESGR